MPLPIDTRATLLLRIRDPRNAEAWREFMAIYEPLIHAIAVRFGFQSADADELTQEVFLTVLEKQHQYQPNGESASFRRWLATVARNAALTRLRRSQAARSFYPTGGTDSVKRLNDAIDPSSDEEAWNKRYEDEERSFLLGWAADQVRLRTDSSTWSAFWMTSIEGVTVEEAARKLGISVGQVYVARCRIVKRLREAVQQYLDAQ